MLETICLIVVALSLGGIMEVYDFLDVILEALMRRVRSVFGLVASVIASSFMAFAFTSAPASSNVRMTSTLEASPHTEYISAVMPSSSLAFTFAPASSSTLAATGVRAKSNGVMPTLKPPESPFRRKAVH